MGVPALCSQSHQAPLGIALCLLQVTQCPLPNYSKEPRMQGLGLLAVSSVMSVHVGAQQELVMIDKQLRIRMEYQKPIYGKAHHFALLGFIMFIK